MAEPHPDHNVPLQNELSEALDDFMAYRDAERAHVMLSPSRWSGPLASSYGLMDLHGDTRTQSQRRLELLAQEQGAKPWPGLEAFPFLKELPDETAEDFDAALQQWRRGVTER